MSAPVIHKIIVKDGKYIVLPPWVEGGAGYGKLAHPDVYTPEGQQQYPVDTIYRDGFRTFVYTRFNTSLGAGVVSAGYCVESLGETKTLSDAVISGAAGAKTFIVNYGGACAENKHAGGFVGIKGSGGDMTTVGRCNSRMITGNTKQDGSNYVTFTIDGTLPIALTTTDDIVLSESPYSYVFCNDLEYVYNMCCGVLVATMVSGYYGWVQTGGPHNMVHMAGTYEGAANGSIPVYYVGGVAQCNTASNSTTPYGAYESASLQVIGYRYASSDIVGPGGTPTDDTVAMPVWLTIFN